MGEPLIPIFMTIAKILSLSKLDIVSPARHMCQTIPSLALSRPVLYYACLAYASHIKVLNGELDASVEEQYGNEAISLLIQALATHSSNNETDEALLATSVILRMSEQFAEIGDDAQRHLGGALSLFTTTSTKWSSFQTDALGTTFWIYIRQSLRLCFLDEVGCRFDINLIEKDTTFTPAADAVWTNRMTYLLAKTCNTCFAEKDRNAQNIQLDELRVTLDLWTRSLPPCFNAWYFRDDDFDLFPTIQFLSAWHGIP